MTELRRAACGLDCNTCNLYLADRDTQAAASLVDWFRARGWIGPDEGTEAIQQQAPFCKGCWDITAKQWCGNCQLRACCNGKSHAHCGECASFPCKEYRDWTVDTPHHQAAMEALLSQRKQRATD